MKTIPYNHRHQESTNRILPYLGTQGTVQALYKLPYLSENVGALFDYVTTIISKSHRPLVHYMDFTLVNICSTFSHYSHGYCPPPPDCVLTPATSVALTFALTGRYYDEASNFDPAFKIRYAGWSYVWGENLRQIGDYYTVPISFNMVRRFTLKPMLPNNCNYLYNVLSSLTKCWIEKQFTYPYLDNMHYNYNKFFNLSIIDILNRYTVQHLPYNKFVWLKAPNLLTQALNYNVVLYFFLYIFETMPLYERTRDDLITSLLYGKTNSIEYFLRQSILEYNENHGANNLLLVAALYGQFNNGSDYYMRLKQIHNNNNLILNVDDARLIIDGLITWESVS